MNLNDPGASALTPREVAQTLAALEGDPTVVALAQAARTLLPQVAALGAKPLRVACLASYTADPIRTALQLQGLRAGLAIETYFTPFGQSLQALIDPASSLATFKPDVIILAERFMDGCPAIYDAFNSLAPAEANRLADDWLAGIGSALKSYRQRSDARILIQGCEQPGWAAMGIADRTSGHSQAALIMRVNDELTKIAADIGNAHVMDYDSLIAWHGRRQWTDRRLALLARMPIAPARLWALAGFYVRHIRPLVGLTKKVLVLDADNTLWGGVVGDVGVEGIELGPDHPGSAYVAFQRRVLDLHQRGIVLCIASKNEPGIVEDVLARHPNMVLKSTHFANIKANWSPKPDNLRQMSQELNLGLDSFVFLDDSPVECELMRASLPEVTTVQLGDDASNHAAVVESLDCFEQWTLTEEDRQRGAMYVADAGRRLAAAAAVDMPSFYRSLDMRLFIAVDDAMQTARVAQLTQRTNQFNMHAIRCTDADIRRYQESPDCHVLTARLVDRFGDNGIIGAAVVERSGADWVTQIFLMSCRVLGRTVEQSFLKWIARFAKEAGAARLTCLFKATPKNQQFSGFYRDSGMRLADNGEVVQRWEWELSRADLDLPIWITIDAAVMPK